MPTATETKTENKSFQKDPSIVGEMLIRFMLLCASDEGRFMRSMHVHWANLDSCTDENDIDAFVKHVSEHAKRWAQNYVTGKETIDNGLNLEKDRVQSLFGPLTTACARDLHMAIGGRITSPGRMTSFFKKASKDRSTASLVRQLIG